MLHGKCKLCLHFNTLTLEFEEDSKSSKVLIHAPELWYLCQLLICWYTHFIVYGLYFKSCQNFIRIEEWSSLKVSDVEGHFITDMEGRKKRIVLVLDIVCLLFTSIYGLVRNCYYKYNNNNIYIFNGHHCME